MSDYKQLTDFLSGKRVLITAGPTRESIDDVRFISNHSSGKMGYALAEQAHRLGAAVTLISGPVNLNINKAIEIIKVESAEDMYQASVNIFPNMDIAIMTAAVADYTLESKFSGKLKKEQIGDEMILRLKPTKDILAAISGMKMDNQLVIGFALEAQNEVEYGREKLKKKNCNIIVINSANKPDSGFGGDNNKITIINDKGLEKSYPVMTKTECAIEILIAGWQYFI
jgi:phosphopantothenoylcysteine decarboxylase/phosphopantothenate--cysteine ligase